MGWTLDQKVSTAEVLGHVIAHELGHLLLNTPGHSTHGIMHGEWNLPTFRTLSAVCCFSRRSRRRF